MRATEIISAGEQGSSKHPGVGRSTAFRALAFFSFWLLLTNGEAGDLAPGLIAAAAATWSSLRLLPVDKWDVRPIKLVGFVLHFLHQSFVAGTDVALRALQPRLPLQPGFVAYRPGLTPGPKRNMFCAIMSLMPGTLPCGPSGDDSLIVHCLDVTQSVAEQLSVEEARFVQALGGAGPNV